jgi:L-alanine-DL-glutamate epimerase-like enolase superfamily enzyme
MANKGSIKRRKFIASTAAVSMGFGFSSCAEQINEQRDPNLPYPLLDQQLNRSIIERTLFPDPVIIESLDLRVKDGNFLCQVRASSGAEGLCISNNAQMRSLYPIFINRLQPFFIGKDARDLEDLLTEVYVYQSNYKLQNLALWVPLATIEFAILDLLGRIAGKSMGGLIGKITNPEIGVYQANNYRGKSAEESLEGIVKTTQETGAKAVKFKIGGRMSNPDTPPGRTEKLIPMVRNAFGDDMTIYADSNGSYDVDEAIRIGKILESHDIDFYEEPVPFDWYQETLEVARALEIPIAGGEQEPSLHQFRWLIANHALDIVQPDIFYFGGMIRSMKVALMANALGKPCIPHISGSGLGYLYMMHFVSALPNAGPYHEFKGFNNSIPFNCDTSDFKVLDGKIKVPTGAGSGIEIDPEFIASHTLVSA